MSFSACLKSDKWTDHHDPWSTEAALAAIAPGYSLLRRMRIFGATDPFYRNHMLAIDADQRCEAGID